MKIETLLNSMVRDLWVDLQEPAVGWQLLVLAACLLAARLLERRLLAWWASAQPSAGALPIGAGSGSGSGSEHAEGELSAAARPGIALRMALQTIGRVLLPAFALGLVLVARPVLALWHKTNLLRVAIVLLIALVLARAIVYAVSRFSRTRGVAAFKRLLVALVWVTVALHLTGYWSDVVEFLEAVVLTVGRQHVSLWSVLSGGFWVIVTLLVSMWLGGVLEARLLVSGVGDPGVRAVLGRVLRALLLMLAVLVGMSLVGLDITALSVFGGALGVGIGLGLQRIASSYISGFVVLLERRVRIGDVISVDKYTGQVREIRTRFTIVASGDGWEAIVPNELLMTNTVQNFSQQRQVRLVSALCIAYGCDIERLLGQLRDAAAAHPVVLPAPPPLALLRGFGSDGFNVEVGYSIADPALRAPTESDVNRALWRVLEEAGVSPAPARRDIVLRKDSLQG